MNVLKLNNLNEKDTKEIIATWKTSVEATHDFLTKEDIVNLEPQVIEGAKYVENFYVLKNDLGIIYAFLGVHDHKIEMLFVDNKVRGKGTGKFLINFAIQSCKATLVDVNEQNIQGVGFYKHMGFKEIGRSETDDAGNPFPILHLSL